MNLRHHRNHNNSGSKPQNQSEVNVYRCTSKHGTEENELLEAWLDSNVTLFDSASYNQIRTSVADFAKTNACFNNIVVTDATLANRRISAFFNRIKNNSGNSIVAEGATKGTWSISPLSASVSSSIPSTLSSGKKIKRLGDQVRYRDREIKRIRQIIGMEDKGQGKEATSSSSKPPCGSVLNRKTQRSVQFKQHVREAFLVQPNLTEKKFPAMANTLVWAYLGHLLENKVITLAGHFEMDDLMNEVIAVTPSAPTVASIITECGEIDDFYLSKELDKLVVIYACFDGGNKKGRKFEFQLEAGWDPVLRHIIQRTTDSTESGGSGVDHADAVNTTLRRLGQGTDKLVGQCSDSAADVKSGALKEHRKKKPGFIGVGCMLHILNLILMNAYHEAFGEEKQGVPSALRTGYMVPYLIDKFYERFEQYCDEQNRRDMKHHVATASKNRWWSVTQSFGDIMTDPDFYSDFCMHMSNTVKTESAYRTLFEDTSAWLKSDKVRADLTFVQAFCGGVWNKAMLFLQGEARWMEEENLPQQFRLSGFRADEMTRFCVTLHRELAALRPRESEIFSSWRTMVDQLGPILNEKNEVIMTPEAHREAAYTEAEAFCNFAVSVCETHFKPWLLERVDTGLADIPEVAFALAKRLLAIYDGTTLPFIEPEVDVVIDENAVPLGPLIDDMTQFATSSSLKALSVFFMHEDVVVEIRKWVGTGEQPESLRQRIEAYIRPMFISSHCAERTVQAGALFIHQYAGQQRESQIASKISARANSTLEEMKQAYADFLADVVEQHKTAKLRADKSSSWRRRGKSVRRTAGRTQNKSMLKRCLQMMVNRANRVTGVVVAQVKAMVRKRNAEGVDREGAAKRRKQKRIAQHTADATDSTASGNKRKQYTDADRSNRAVKAARKPRASGAGMINLDAKGKGPGVGDLHIETGDKKASKADLAHQLDVRGLSHQVKRVGPETKLAQDKGHDIYGKLPVGNMTNEALVKLLAPFARTIEGNRYIEKRGASVGWNGASRIEYQTPMPFTTQTPALSSVLNTPLTPGTHSTQPPEGTPMRVSAPGLYTPLSAPLRPAQGHVPRPFPFSTTPLPETSK